MQLAGSQTTKSKAVKLTNSPEQLRNDLDIIMDPKELEQNYKKNEQQLLAAIQDDYLNI